MVFAFAGDSTTTSALAIFFFTLARLVKPWRTCRRPRGVSIRPVRVRKAVATDAPIAAPCAPQSRPNRTTRRLEVLQALGLPAHLASACFRTAGQAPLRYRPQTQQSLLRP